MDKRCEPPDPPGDVTKLGKWTEVNNSKRKPSKIADRGGKAAQRNLRPTQVVAPAPKGRTEQARAGVPTPTLRPKDLPRATDPSAPQWKASEVHQANAAQPDEHPDSTAEEIKRAEHENPTEYPMHFAEEAEGQPTQHLDNYACAKAEYFWRLQGQEREMTTLEMKTLFLWASKQIYLDSPPNFITETHSGPEQDFLLDFHRDELGYRLFAKLPAGFRLPENSSKWHFCLTLIKSSNSDANMKGKAKQLIRNTRAIRCDSKSAVVELLFITPTLQARWNHEQFRFGKGHIRFLATKTISGRESEARFDIEAKQLMYQVQLIGQVQLSGRTIRQIIERLTDVEVCNVVDREPAAAVGFEARRWTVTFATRECPTAIHKVRHLEVQKGAEKFEFLVHHPATSKLPPCHQCYGQFHLEKDCTTKDPTASRAAVSRLVQIGELRKIPFSIPINLNDLKKSLQEVRAALQPEISNRPGKEKKEKPSNRSPKSRSKATQANEAPVTKEAELTPLSQDKKRTPTKGPTLHVQITNELIEMQREDMDKAAKVKTKEDKTKDANVGQCDRTDQAKQEENKQREPDTDELMVEARIELLIQDSAKETKAHESTTIHENATTKSKRARAFSEEHYEQDLITATSMQPPPRQARANTIQKSIMHRRTTGSYY